MNIQERKVGVIGCGFVGASSAFALMQSGLFSEIVLNDADRAKAEGGGSGHQPRTSFCKAHEDLCRRL